MWEEIATQVCSGTSDGFWRALEIWLNKPHVLNRRLCSSHDLEKFCINLPMSSLITADQLKTWQDEVRRSPHTRLEELIQSVMHSAGSEKGDNNCTSVDVTVRDLLPKQTDRFPTLREIILIDRSNCTAVFLPLLNHRAGDDVYDVSCDICYAFQLQSVDTSLSVRLLMMVDGRGGNAAQSPTPNQTSTVGCSQYWLTTQLLTRLCNWSRESSLNTEISSIKLISVHDYNMCYQRLKAKYATDLVQNWPESTDPQKFVFEDINIAAYLITLWEEERRRVGLEQKQSFVDLGCGNGLLVYLLASEGYPGIGIDIRRRNIWDMFESVASLKEMSLTPSDDHLFPEYDWLIGNHSDELTPWIPVMAARSSYTCRYFVLPCCAHDFDGKYSGKSQGLSQYRCYLNYVSSVGEMCGFNVQEDMLRIPSTKRVCFIGQTRSYPESEEREIDGQRSQFIASRLSHQRMANASSAPGNGGPTSKSNGAGDAQAWASTFKVRVEDIGGSHVTRSSEVKDTIMRLVFETLLAHPAAVQKPLADGRTWNTGGVLALEEVAALVTSEQRQKLKSECGGLQTLLRNCNHIFRVQEGKVHIRSWDEPEEYIRVTKAMKKKGKDSSRREQLHKTKLCWLHSNHPDGCPRPVELCCFAHGEEDLRIPMS